MSSNSSSQPRAGSSSWQASSSSGVQHASFHQHNNTEEPSSSSLPAAVSSSESPNATYSTLPSNSFPHSTFRLNSSYNRTQYADSYGISGSYQSAESSYGGPSESQSGGSYPASASSSSEVQPMQDYSSLGSAEGFHTGQSHHLASSSVSHSRNYNVQEVMLGFPSVVVDSTSQSGMGTTVRRHTPGEATHTTQRTMMLQPSSSSQVFLSSMTPSYATSEVSTTDGSTGMLPQGHHHGDGDISQGHGEAEIVRGRRNRGEIHPTDGMESAVSSISGSTGEEVEVTARVVVKHHENTVDDLDISGEPDTTQNDEDFQPAEDFMNDSPNIADSLSLNQRNIALNCSRPSSGSMADSVMDGEPLSSSQVMLAGGHDTSYQGNRGQMVSLQRMELSNSVFNDLRSQNLSANQIGPSHAPANQLQGLTAPLMTSSGYDGQVAALMPSYHGLDSVVGASTSGQEEKSGPSMVPADQGQGSSQPLPSHVSRRKSNRISIQDAEPQTWRRPQYQSKPYNPAQLWCEECMSAYDEQCPLHKLVMVHDKVVFSRAWASLPQALQIFRLSEGEDSVELGVFAKRTIMKHTQFGPFIAEVTDDRSRIQNDHFPLQVERPDGVMFYEKSDENKCNWMMFVRPAETYSEQNVVAYQHGNDIFFTVIKQIEAKQELKVWYATHYGDYMGVRRLEVTEEDMQAMEEQQCKFQCYECPKKFRTASALQKHLAVHDEVGSSKPGTSDAEPSTSQTYERGENRPRKKRNVSAMQNYLKRIQQAKKIKDMSGDNQTSTSSGIYHWKKRSTNIYLNKTLKKYQKRHDTDAMRRSVQSMYRKTGENSEGNEWACNTCDLTFDNSNLLNLHTLTHAAEDVGMDEVRKFTYQGDGEISLSDLYAGQESSLVAIQQLLACPVCQVQFTNKTDLIDHASTHGQKRHHVINVNRPHKCGQCWKSFTTGDRLQQHQLCHGDDILKPLQCSVCYKRFMNNSALSCHMKTHSADKYYECPICREGFDQASAMREHSLIHANADGLFNCPHCDKCFAEFLVLKKHVRGFHTNRTYPCIHCDKTFPRPDKLRLHMLRHSTVREFMCDTCGRQFKRKDKLKEHCKRMHSIEREERDRLKNLTAKPRRFIPKVAPTEYHRFIYKCHICLLGFKRRGMLVNHIAKKHPDIKPTSVPELNLPILKTQRDYYCQYCDKVYKSSSKRKVHILKNHPGAELPQSSRKKTGVEDIPGMPNPTYSQTVGSITTMPHQCEHCHKQYASKAKLLQHLRKKHIDMLSPADRQKRVSDIMGHIPGELQAGTIQVVERFDGDGNEEATGQDGAQATDLLTQAMSELTQSLQEYRHTAPSSTLPEGTPIFSTRLGQGPPAMIQIQAPGGAGGAASTIDMAQLNQALQQFGPALQVQVSGSNTQTIQIPILPAQPGTSEAQAHILTVDPLAVPSSPATSTTTATQGQAISFPINIVSGNFMPSKAWASYSLK